MIQTLFTYNARVDIFSNLVMNALDLRETGCMSPRRVHISFIYIVFVVMYLSAFVRTTCYNCPGWWYINLLRLMYACKTFLCEALLYIIYYLSQCGILFCLFFLSPNNLSFRHLNARQVNTIGCIDVNFWGSKRPIVKAWYQSLGWENHLGFGG